MTEEPIQYPSSYKRVTMMDGSFKMVSEPDENTFVQGIIDHIIGCKDFECMAVCFSPMSFNTVIGCGCGARWEISERHMRAEGKSEMRLHKLMWAIQNGEISKSNTFFMGEIANRRCNNLKDEIVRKMDRLKLMKAEIEAEKKSATKKKLSHPIFSLDVK